MGWVLHFGFETAMILAYLHMHYYTVVAMLLLVVPAALLPFSANSWLGSLMLEWRYQGELKNFGAHMLRIKGSEIAKIDLVKCQFLTNGGTNCYE